jgi:PAS domain S-box-containing protein
VNEQERIASIDRQALPEGELVFRNMADNAPVLIWASGPDGHGNFFNEGWLRFTGRTMEEEVGEGWVERVHPEDRDRCLEIYRQHFERRTSFEREFRLRRHDGEYRCLLDRASPHFRPEGEFAGFIGACVDVTEFRAEHEALVRSQTDLERRVEERTQELLTVNHELESFTYSVSHDLRAPLRAISGYASILIDEYGDRLDDEGRRMLGRQIEAASRMEALIGDLLQYSRLGRSDLVRADFDLTRLAREVADEIASRSWGVPVHVEVAPGLRAYADARLLRTVIQNLIENAVKYSVPKGEALVTLSFENDAYAVRDRGIGFDMRHADKLFEPFERLHRAADFPGTGIGLANVRKVVQRHGGRTWAESVPGEGSVFYFTLG